MSGRQYLPKFFGICRDGKLVYENPDAFQCYLSWLEGREFELTCQPRRKEKSNRENRYFHGVVVDLLADHWGESHEDAFSRIKARWFKRVDDSGTERILSTENRKWTTAAWEAKMEEIRRDCAFEGLNIPMPNEYLDRYEGSANG